MEEVGVAEETIGLFDEGFVEYFESGQFSDVDIVHVDSNTRYKCHRIILSYASIFFRKALEQQDGNLVNNDSKGSGISNDNEKSSSSSSDIDKGNNDLEKSSSSSDIDNNSDSSNTQIQVQFSDEEQVFGKLLKFLYSGKVELSAANVVAIQLAANHFQVDMLSKAVEKFLDANFSEENVFAILDKSACLDQLLLKKAVAFIAKQFDKMLPQLKERLAKGLPVDIFLSIIGHEHLKEQAEKRSPLVMELLTEFMSKYDVMNSPELLIKVIDAVLASETLNSDSATMFLVHCDKLGLAKQAAGCAQVLAANFYTLSDKKFIFELSCDTFCSLLRSDDLFIKSEDSVYEIANQYVEKNCAALSTQQQRDVLSTVRYTFLSIDKLQILKDSTSELIDLDTIVDALWARLCRLERDKEEEKILCEANSNLRLRKNRVFLYSSDFDKNGIMYWLGTKCGEDKYINPHTRGNVTVSHSANCEVGKTPDLIAFDPCTCNLVSSANTTITIKLHDYSVLPTKYTLRHTMSRDSECLRNWRFQGSINGTTFVDLSVHQNDTSLNVKGATKTWSLDPVKACDYYQYFRILQDGNNSSNNTYLSLAGLELYGYVMKLIAK